MSDKLKLPYGWVKIRNGTAGEGWALFVRRDDDRAVIFPAFWNGKFWKRALRDDVTDLNRDELAIVASVFEPKPLDGAFHDIEITGDPKTYQVESMRIDDGKMFFVPISEVAVYDDGKWRVRARFRYEGS